MSRFQAGRIALGVGAALNIASMLFPWEDPQNHYHKLCSDWASFVDLAQAGSWAYGVRVLAEGLGCISPSFLGVVLLLSAVLPRGRVNALASSFLQIALFVVLTAVAGVLFGYDVGAEGADQRFHLATAVGSGVLLVLTALECIIARRALRRSGGSGDAPHVLPLVLFFLVGTALAVVLRGSEVWHSVDYAIIGIGSALALAGVWLRREGGARGEAASADAAE